MTRRAAPKVKGVRVRAWAVCNVGGGPYLCSIRPTRKESIDAYCWAHNYSWRLCQIEDRATCVRILITKAPK